MNIGTPSLPAVALIAGPTASGKSALALALARRTGGVIVNADSAQVYRDLRIVSARPDAAEEAETPHLLYGYRDGAEPCSAADWAADARAAVDETHAAGRLPILAGGTGLYLRTLLDGIAPMPPIDANVRSSVRKLTAAEAHEALTTEDPEAAAGLRPSDTSRLARALEVVRSTGQTLAAWQARRVGGIGSEIQLAPLLLLPPRAWLYERCDRRFEIMAGSEGREEVRQLLSRRLDPSLPVMRAIGVAEIAAVIAGTISREKAVLAGQMATRRYAKRQYTWFAHQPPLGWPRLTEPLDSGEAMEDALARLTNMLGAPK